LEATDEALETPLSVGVVEIVPSSSQQVVRCSWQKRQGNNCHEVRKSQLWLPLQNKRLSIFLNSRKPPQQPWAPERGGLPPWILKFDIFPFNF